MDEAHLAAAVLYVALNPVRARLVQRADDWRWSSVRAHLDPARGDGLTDPAPVAAALAAHKIIAGMSRGDGFDLGGGLGAGRSSDGRRAEFKPRLGRIRRDHPGSFIGKASKAVARAKAASWRTKYPGTSGRFNTHGRGSKIAPGLIRSYGWHSDPGPGSGTRFLLVAGGR